MEVKRDKRKETERWKYEGWVQRFYGLVGTR